MDATGKHQTDQDPRTERARLSRAEIEALMAIPLRPPPSIIVLGDEAVSAIRLPEEPAN